MSGDWLTLGAVAALAAIGAVRRGSASDQWVDSYLYHATNLGSLRDSIWRQGLRAVAGPVHLTEPEGLQTWFPYAGYEDESEPGAGVPVVLRVLRRSVDGLQVDPQGTKDAEAPAYTVSEQIASDRLEVWTGAEWVAVDRWSEVEWQDFWDKVNEGYAIVDTPLMPNEGWA